MTDYTIALFVHIVGALGMFVALALEWVVQATKSAAGPGRTRSRATVTSGVTLERVRKKEA